MQNKQSIGLHVVAIIKSHGCRFISEMGRMIYYEVDDKRALEKACQLLREKKFIAFVSLGRHEQANVASKLLPYGVEVAAKPTDSYPTVKILSTSSFNQTSPALPITMQKKVLTNLYQKSALSKPTAPKVNSKSTTLVAKSSPSSVKVKQKTAVPTKKKQQVAPQKKSAAAASKVSVVSPFDSSSKVYLRKLVSFTRKHGHCGVPPNWAEDPRLADWCASKRQLRREMIRRYRDFSDDELKLVARLESMGFVWDYREWHWHVHFARLAGVTPAVTTAEQDSGEAAKDPALRWVQDQHDQLGQYPHLIDGREALQLQGLGYPVPTPQVPDETSVLEKARATMPAEGRVVVIGFQNQMYS